MTGHPLSDTKLTQALFMYALTPKLIIVIQINKNRSVNIEQNVFCLIFRSVCSCWFINDRLRGSGNFERYYFVNLWLK